MKDRVAIVIPARYASSRFPGKPLADILGKPMIQHVYERALSVPDVISVVVATDDQRIADTVDDFEGDYLMTSPDHESGTDRLVEVMQALDADIYINLQGDEPLVRADDIDLLASRMRNDPGIDIGTLCHEISVREARNPNAVKVVLAANEDALFFSRSPIPYPREEDEASYLKHVGIYGYRKNVLASYSSLKQPMIEKTEKLEQLRFLHAGYRIRAFRIAPTGSGVDTPECLEQVRAILRGEVIDQKPLMSNVRLVITDVDGVLTDGSLFYDENGESMKRFHVRDGLGMRVLEENGIQVAVVSGRDSATLRKRVGDLGLSLCLFGKKDKAEACREIMRSAGVSSDATLFLGDDSIDLPAFAVCGLSYAVADAPDYVKACASGILTSKGGEGAFRELADAILNAQNKSSAISTPEGFASIMNNVSQ